MNYPEFLITQYTNFLQAQLRTGPKKPRTWFATRMHDSKQVVIKGPVSAADAAAALESQRLKDLLGIPSSQVRQEGEFLIQDCLFDYTALPTEIQSSRWDKAVRVPRDHHLSGWSHVWMLEDSSTANVQKNKELRLSLFESLLFRKVVGTNDTCTHNLVIRRNQVYSIDDAAVQKRTRFMWKSALDPVIAESYLLHLKELWPDLQRTAARWRTLLDSQPYRIRILDTLMRSPDSWRF